MDILLLVLGIILLLVGIAGSILPILPGPAAAWFSLLLIHWTDYAEFESRFLIITSVLTLAAIGLDYVIPAWGTRRFGGSKMGERGALIGVFAGILIGPWGIIIGPFIGAFIGEILHNRNNVDGAMRAAVGSFIGFLTGTGIKLILCLVFAWYFFRALFV